MNADFVCQFLLYYYSFIYFYKRNKTSCLYTLSLTYVLSLCRRSFINTHILVFVLIFFFWILNEYKYESRIKMSHDCMRILNFTCNFKKITQEIRMNNDRTYVASLLNDLSCLVLRKHNFFYDLLWNKRTYSQKNNYHTNICNQHLTFFLS